MNASPDLTWMDHGVCLQVGPDLFFDDGQGHGGSGESAEARALCRSCEVRVPCLAWALQNNVRDGVFGGFTERPRLKVAREHRAGRSLEDIISADDAAFYARTEALGTPKERRLAAERRRRAARNERTLAASAPDSQNREEAAA